MTAYLSWHTAHMAKIWYPWTYKLRNYETLTYVEQCKVDYFISKRLFKITKVEVPEFMELKKKEFGWPYGAWRATWMFSWDTAENERVIKHY